jgi:hypothetical protein
LKCGSEKAHRDGAEPLGCGNTQGREAAGSGIISGFSRAGKSNMEAERINAIGNKIADLAARGTELRRYL